MKRISEIRLPMPCAHRGSLALPAAASARYACTMPRVPNCFPPFRTPRHGLARVLSKLGICSRSQAEQWIRSGRVALNGQLVRDPEYAVAGTPALLTLDGQPLAAAERVYVMFNKPRGLLVTASDEHGRDTVYTALAHAGLPWLGPVGRLDKASEGLLLLSNDTAWATGITSPATHLNKTYHVQIDRVPDPALLVGMRNGVLDQGEQLTARRVELLRSGEKNAWLEIVLDEGRNRHIRRLLAAQDIGVLRLIRVAIGPLVLGPLAKGAWRYLSEDEVWGLQSR